MREAPLGAVVTAAVTRVEEYGVYLSFEGHEILVLITDIRDERISDLRALFAIGEHHRVRLVRRVLEQPTHFVGSIKDAS